MKKCRKNQGVIITDGAARAQEVVRQPQQGPYPTAQVAAPAMAMPAAIICSASSAEMVAPQAVTRPIRPSHVERSFSRLKMYLNIPLRACQKHTQSKPKELDRDGRANYNNRHKLLHLWLLSPRENS